MGNQGTAADGLRRAVELIQAGVIGNVSEAHVWTNRPIWPQAPKIVARPTAEPVPGEHPLGRIHRPSADAALQPRVYHTVRLARLVGFRHRRPRRYGLPHRQYGRSWRSSSTIPTSIVAESGEINPETYPAWAHITFQFPARGEMPPVKFVWYEGKKTPESPNVLPAPELVKGQGEREKGYSIYFKDGKWIFKNGDKKTNVTSGSFLIGDKATLFSPDDYGSDSYIITTDGVERVKGKPEKLASNNGGDRGQKVEWVKAIKENKPALAFSNFDYAAMLTETILLGNVAMRIGKPLEWNGADLRVTNVPEAAALIKPEYRKGWSL